MDNIDNEHVHKYWKSFLLSPGWGKKGEIEDVMKAEVGIAGN